MKKFRFSLISFTLIFTLLLSACSSGDTVNSGSNTKGNNNGSSSSDQIQLNYWYPWGGDSEKWDLNRIASFESLNPNVKITATYVPPDGGLSNGKLVAAISGKNPPDVVISSSYASAYSLAAQGALEPLDEHLKTIGFQESDVLSSFSSLMKHNDTTYLFPQDSNVNMLFYNVQMFIDAGLDPDNPPTTIEELDAAAEKLTQVNGNQIDRLGFIPWIDAGEDAFLWGWVFGADFLKENGDIYLQDPKLEKMFTWMNSYAKKYNPEKIKSYTSGFGGAFSPDHPFFTGKVAMTINGNWFANALNIYAPDIEYRVAVIPHPEGGRENATTFDTNVFMIPKGAKNVEAALKFIQYAGQPEALAENINVWRSISIYTKPTDVIKWDAEGDEVYKVVRKISESPNSGHPALTPVANEMANEIELLRDSVIYNDNDPAKLLKDAEAKLQKALNDRQ